MSNYSLSLPYVASIPYRVQIHETLSFAAKLYFGQIVPLAHKEGYMWATDEQLAEMKGVSVRTIQRWHSELEEADFIYRDSTNVPVKGDDGKFSWVRKRRIYINDAWKLPPEIEAKKKNSKKVTDSDINVGSLDSDISVGSLDSDISGAINISSLNKQKEQQQQKPKAVVIFSSLEKMEDISENTKEKICQEYTEPEVDLAVSRCIGWKSRPSDEVGLLTALSKKDSWKDNLSSEQKVDKNIEILKKFQNLDGTKIARTDITVGNKYIEFVSGMKVVTYKVDDDDFKTRVLEYIEHLRNCEENS